MPQSTNLNKSPYFDDFSEDKNYYKVLFKPGITVQTRELTTLQSILQNQIEKFGNSFYSSGGVVIPGGFNYDPSFYCVEIESSYNGISVEDYYNNLIGVTVEGRNTGVKATIVKVISKIESERENTTLYLKYISSSQNSTSSQFSGSTFENGEELITSTDIAVGSSYIFAGSSFAKTISPTNRESTSIASAAKINNGVYFVRGYFVDVIDDTIILDQYSNTPSYRVGLKVTEEIINSDQDSSLNDNAQGFSNYAAPGADRLKISLGLTKKDLTDFNDTNFIELFRVESGIVKYIKPEDKYAFITDILARRTYDESGNYCVGSINVEALESLNDRIGNNGLYLETQKTSEGSTPSDDLGVLKVSPGKAYVKGYEVSLGTVVVDYPKPRDTELVESSSATFYAGDIIRVNNVTGCPNIGLTTSYTISLLDKRVSGSSIGSATTIGVARVYDFESHNTAYENASSQFNLNLFDIQTYTTLGISTNISGIATGSYVKGNSSNSSGFVKNFSGTSITIYQSSGKFITGEQLLVNGIQYSPTITSIRDYSIDDVKSVFSNTDSTNFLADAVLSKTKSLSGTFFVQADGSSNLTITSNDGSSFASSLKVNDVLKYTRTGLNLPLYVGITSVYATLNKVLATASTSVTNVCSNSVGVSTNYQVTDLSAIYPEIVSTQENSSLYVPLADANISEVSTLNSSIYVKKVQNINRGGSPTTTLTLNTLVGDYTYAAYDEERYSIINQDGSVENLSTATFTRSSGNKNAQFTNLSSVSGVSKIITTQIKSNVTSKYKKLNRCSSISVEKTKYSTPPVGSGLTTNSVYGLRVEDQEISLNYPDIVELHGVYQSADSTSPNLPSLTLTGILPTTDLSNLIPGELIVGQESGAAAIFVSSVGVSSISIVNKNSNSFLVSEKVVFSESGYTADISEVRIGSQNIINDFILDNGQRQHFYDFGRIVRKNNSKEPSGKLKIIFDYFDYESTDNGDIITFNSYPSSLKKSKIPSYNNIKNSDTIDVRPRVSNYVVGSSSLSPFDFLSRNFSSSGSNASEIMTSNEDFVFDYSHYLPRTDKLTINSEGEVMLVLGTSSKDPKVPPISNEVLDLATIYGSAYVYDINNDVTISLTDNKRYTMSDLRDIENRVSNLEETTSLNLLEVSTNNLLIEDADGFNRFKSGFFVDNFSSYDISDTTSSIYRSEIDSNTLGPITVSSRVNLTLFDDDSQATISEVDLTNTNSSNVKITGDIISLDYDPVPYVSQEFASRIINVNPYSIVSWTGNLTLNPSSDYWAGRFSYSYSEANPELKGSTASYVDYFNAKYIRSRNIEFVATRLKPNTQYNVLFDSRNLSSADLGTTSAFPKILEIANVYGTFTVGESVLVYNSTYTSLIGEFRVCTPNHKSGPHDNPDSVYTYSPYDPAYAMPSSYGPQSTFLNVDTTSLQSTTISDFYGNITTGAYLVGQTSGASAVVANNRLIADNNGTLIGSIFIPDPFASPISYPTGSTTVEIIQQTVTGAPGELVSSAQAIYTTEGDIARITSIAYYDPVAQSFIVEDVNGIYPTSVDVYFQSKDDNLPVTLQIREVVNGYPGGPDKVVANLEKVLEASKVNVSQTAEVATTFTFDNLARLEGGKEYAIVLLSDSFNYNVWISRLGETDIITANKSEVEQIIVNTQPSLGSLFISQNGTTWTAAQTDDLKFTLNRCDFSSNGGTVRLYNSSSYINSAENKLSQNPIYVGVGSDIPNNGNYMKVTHSNHGMYSSGSKVTLSGVISDILPVTLSVGYGITLTTNMQISDTTNFANFEGSAVTSLNPGYISVNNEIIKYTGVSGNFLTGISRAQNSTTSISHEVNSLVYKYEFNGVSLFNINKEHAISGNGEITLDSYYIDISPKTFTTSKFGGGDNVYASSNNMFSELILPENFIQTPNGASANISVRTISGTSADGSETPFVDQGYTSIGIGITNTFNTTRIVSSKENESTFLNDTQFAGKKSLTLDVNLSTSDSNVSPTIDINQSYLTLNSYRLNSPISLDAYPTDSRVNSDIDDPHAFIYVSKKVDLLESATAIKVIFDAYKPSNSDIRVLYKIYRNDTPNETQVWELFPGYNNLDVNGNIKSEANNDGSADSAVPISLLNQYLENDFTMNNLPSFTGFAIKIVCSSTNQASVPLIKNLRAIALK